MPKAKPVSLHPLSFEQVIDTLIRAAPEKAVKKKMATVKPKKLKKS